MCRLYVYSPLRGARRLRPRLQVSHVPRLYIFHVCVLSRVAERVCHVSERVSTLLRSRRVLCIV